MNSNVGTSGGCVANSCGMSTQQTNVWEGGCNCGKGPYNSCGKNRYIIPVDTNNNETNISNYLKNKQRTIRNKPFNLFNIFKSKPKPKPKFRTKPRNVKPEYYHPKTRSNKIGGDSKIRGGMTGVF